VPVLVQLAGYSVLGTVQALDLPDAVIEEFEAFLSTVRATG